MTEIVMHRQRLLGATWGAWTSGPAPDFSRSSNLEAEEATFIRCAPALPTAWLTPYFENDKRGNLVPVIVSAQSNLDVKDDWAPLYAPLSPSKLDRLDDWLWDWRKGLRNCWEEDEYPSLEAIETYVSAIFDFIKRGGDLEAPTASPSPRVTEAPPIGVEACTGCGSTETIEQIRAKHPGALSCCPERKMVPATQLIRELWDKAYPAPTGVEVTDAQVEQACEIFDSGWHDQEPFVQEHYRKNMRAVLEHHSAPTAIEITDAMVERALDAWFLGEDRSECSEEMQARWRREMRDALQAGLSSGAEALSFYRDAPQHPEWDDTAFDGDEGTEK